MLSAPICIMLYCLQFVLKKEIGGDNRNKLISHNEDIDTDIYGYVDAEQVKGGYSSPQRTDRFLNLRKKCVC